MSQDEVQTSTLVDRIADKIRQMILSGEVQPGDVLPPRKELAARFGVGASTINEATKTLAAVGLLESRAGKGTWVRRDEGEFVIPPTAIRNRLGALDIRVAFEARQVIEVALTELAAQRATAAEIRRMQAAIEHMRRTQDNELEFSAADLEFHLAVAQAGDNDLLFMFYSLARHLLFELIKLPFPKEEAIRLQANVAAAIERHDSQSARAAALELMNRIAATLDSH